MSDHLLIGGSPPPLVIRCTGDPLCQGWSTIPYGQLRSPNAVRNYFASIGWGTGRGTGEGLKEGVFPLCPGCHARIGGHGAIDVEQGAAKAPAGSASEQVLANKDGG